MPDTPHPEAFAALEGIKDHEQLSNLDVKLDAIRSEFAKVARLPSGTEPDLDRVLSDSGLGTQEKELALQALLDLEEAVVLAQYDSGACDLGKAKGDAGILAAALRKVWSSLTAPKPPGKQE
jgi:hypothetical protein